MLLFDDEKIEVPEEFIKQFNKLDQKAVFRMLKKFDSYDRLNDKTRRPNSLSIETFYSYPNPSAKDPRKAVHGVIRYATHRLPKVDDLPSYNPSMILFGGNSHVADAASHKGVDFFYFMINHPKMIREGAKLTEYQGKASKNPIFYLENIEEENKAISVSNKDRLKALNLIWDDEKGLTLDELKDVGSALGFASVQDMKEEGVKNRLDHFVNNPTKDERNPATKFIASISGETTIVLALIQECIDEDLITYNFGKKDWLFHTKHARAGETICHVKPNAKTRDYLANYFIKKDSEVMADLEFTLTEIKKGVEA